jgi:DsbC/DsbD-like thiol-disulfide interchange protein
LLRLLQLICMLSVLAAPMPVAGGQGADVAVNDHSTVRLFAALAPGSKWSAGLEIALAEGWKTYWRMPGDSGVPPVLDWSASRNLANLTMAWPAPQRFSDAAGETIGYKDKVVFPLQVKPLAEDMPVALDLKLFYAACNNICIPAEAHVQVEFRTTDRGHAADIMLIDQFARSLPAEPVPGSRPSISGLYLNFDGGNPALEVAIDGKLEAAATDIFIEGFDRAYFRKPRPKEDQPLVSAFTLTIDGLKDAAELHRQTLTVTLVSGATRLVQRLPVN